MNGRKNPTMFKLRIGHNRPLMALVFGVLITIPLSAQPHFSSADVEQGSRLYRANCFACHGPDGDSIPGVDFRRGQFKRVSSDADLLRVITGGFRAPPCLPPLSATAIASPW